MIRWHKARDGFASSHCGHWTIVPLFCGCVRAQWFELRKDNVVVEGMLPTHRAAKDRADQLALSHCTEAGRKTGKVSP